MQRGLPVLALLILSSGANGQSTSTVKAAPPCLSGPPITTRVGTPPDLAKPHVTISIKYHDNTGERTTKLSGDQTVSVKWTSFTVFYEACDNEALRDLTIIPGWYTGTANVEPLVAAQPASGRLVKRSFVVTPTAVRYWYTASATDKSGNVGKSPKLTVIRLP